MKNHTTPRTLADCQFRTGYQSASPQPSRLAAFVVAVMDWSFATLIGVAMALALVTWWAA